MLQPKWDGFRLLIEVGADRRARAWSRHGTSLTGRLGGPMAAFYDAPAGSVFDGELVAIAQRDGRPVQDFATVGRAVLRGDTAAAEQLQFVGFDLLALAGEDLRDRPWRERDRRLAEALPACRAVRRGKSRPATPAVHAAIVELGFEGTVLKRPGSLYRPGRHAVWRKYKARHTAEGELLAVRQDRGGHWYGVCDVGGRRVVARAGQTRQAAGQPARLALDVATNYLRPRARERGASTACRSGARITGLLGEAARTSPAAPIAATHDR